MKFEQRRLSKGQRGTVKFLVLGAIVSCWVLMGSSCGLHFRDGDERTGKCGSVNVEKEHTNGRQGGHGSLEEAFRGKARHGEDISVYVKFGESSAKRRFFVYDNRRGKILSTSKCAHGCGGGSTVSKPVFSNAVGSNCSSLGEYRLRSVSRLNGYDIPCIRLDGLSKSNSNAAKRGITIHEGPVLADPITDGIPIPVSEWISQGCFAISTETFKLLCKQLKEGKSIFLYADDNQ